MSDTNYSIEVSQFAASHGALLTGAGPWMRAVLLVAAIYLGVIAAGFVMLAGSGLLGRVALVLVPAAPALFG